MKEATRWRIEEKTIHVTPVPNHQPTAITILIMRCRFCTLLLALISSFASVHGESVHPGRGTESEMPEPIPTVQLNTTNFIELSGEITPAVASKFVADVVHTPRAHYIFINTPGGSVESGLRILREVAHKKFTCIVEQALSMGFVILQQCAVRLVLPNALLMQHQMQLRLEGSLGTVQSTMALIEDDEQMLVDLQARRLHMAPAAFAAKVTNEWWMRGPRAVRNRCADAVLLHVSCARPLVRQSNHTRRRVPDLFSGETTRDGDAEEMVIDDSLTQPETQQAVDRGRGRRHVTCPLLTV